MDPKSAALNFVANLDKNPPAPVVKFKKATNLKLPASQIVLGGAVVGLLLSLALFGAAATTNLIGFAVPLALTNTNDRKQWITYWLLFAGFGVTEGFTSLFVRYVPFYNFVKLLVLVALFAPVIKGAERVYERVLDPALSKFVSAGTGGSKEKPTLSVGGASSKPGASKPQVQEAAKPAAAKGKKGEPKEEEKEAPKPSARTIVFQIPAPCLEQVRPNTKKIEQKYKVEIALKDGDTAVGVTGAGGAVADAQKAIEVVLGFPIGTDPLVTDFTAIDKAWHGKLIGNKKAGLAQLEAKAGCNIEFPKDGSDQVRIDGTPETIQRAKDLLEVRVEELEAEARKAAEEQAQREKVAEEFAKEQEKRRLANLADAERLAACEAAEEERERAEEAARKEKAKLAQKEKQDAARAAVRQAREEARALVEAAKQAEPTADELADLSKACDRLWNLDHNRLTPGKDYEIDIQAGTKPYQDGDHAARPLFKRVDEAKLESGTFKKFYALLDNYERATGVSEVVTQEELYENKDFIHACLQTPVMMYTHRYLVSKKRANPDVEKFAAELYTLWFQLYRRQAQNDSSGFEHVFVGEDKNGQVMGLHNWIQMFQEEKEGRLDYHGFIPPKSARNNVPRAQDQVITIQFAWGGDLKPVSTSFIGTSPEFELAIYTLCFLCGEEKNKVKVGPYKITITCYKIGNGPNAKLGSSFPEVD